MYEHKNLKQKLILLTLFSIFKKSINNKIHNVNNNLTNKQWKKLNCSPVRFLFTKIYIYTIYMYISNYIQKN